ncbi:MULTISPECIES: GNAT family N-acetyltransferase [Lysobacter]|uniref:GNAT family N-acetyltransferase n=1 Tax=Lysobacter gummosus TaxID=262324 RepID=A0ABY3XH07_9GAMM|nr:MULTISPECIES: GNAT family N-acetyltransferase [Lysobacter]ALN90390.1 acetyltransferase family protein [Lysobacter gummosus]UJB17818.1 GNAT family N-acetyltransferase [Lysobacter capsici]UJQ28460.1 GNAT family N-acetyltransferase [Lysobacter gummosus]UNP30919.1 GNAT family N-acetyltransferase [Lysobacter gummosus]
MSVAVAPLRAERLQAALAFDASFLVDSRLSLHADDGAIGFDIVPVSPYRKRYGDAIGVEELREYLDGEDCAAFVALDADAVIGRLLLSRSWNGYALIDDIAVDAGARRGGAGSALIDRALAWAREQALPGVMLETQDNNVAACRFYQRKGFVLGGFDRFHYAHDPALAHETALFWYQLVT